MELNAMLAQEFHIRPEHAGAIIRLLDEGNTIPFIARYRKEMTGAIDDQDLREIARRLEYARNLEARRAEIRQAIEAQGKLDAALEARIAACATLAELEDVYRPFKPKRRTRATIAKERGLGPLADMILAQRHDPPAILAGAAQYADDTKGVPDAQAAVDGALDIIAEGLSDDASIRAALRTRIASQAVLACEGVGEEDSVYRQYYAFSQPVQKLPGHRILAINRGEHEGFLKVTLTFADERAVELILRSVLRRDGRTEPLLRSAAQDSWKRLIQPSLTREVRADLTERAQDGAIDMFGKNLRALLLQPPLRSRVVLGFDPAYRTGCKLAVVDATGKALATAVIYPTPPRNDVQKAREILSALVRRHNVEVIAIGNGTASRESERFVAQVIAEEKLEVQYGIVNEAGASVYSASPLGAQEFPEYDVSLRSAISIARRLQDPMAELVKIEPKSIGVGQYQHDMPPARLNEALGGVVEGCVNAVGVDINTASPSLLEYVAGISPAVARNICAFRDTNGAFVRRAQLREVSKLGQKTFEQCAGFLRVPGGETPLDATAVHPESYGAAQALLTLLGHTPQEARAGVEGLSAQAEAYGWGRAARACKVGEPTLRDIARELERPGRDIRDDLPPPALRSDVMDIADLKPGMELEGVVHNVVDFGAFVDIGVHQDGLVHISELSDEYVRHPSQVVKVGDHVQVWVQEVDAQRGRISLTMVDPKE